MDIDKILKNRKPNKNKLLQYGFIKKDNIYTYQNTLINNEFNIIINIKNNKLYTKVIDINTNDEYLLLKVSSIDGEYIGKVREEYNKVINDIIEKCFDINTFKNKQTKEIIKYIKNKYNEKPEFLWDDESNAAIRHKEDNTWYAVLMTVEKNKLGFDSCEVVEIINLKLPPTTIENIIDNKTYLKAYHMNKKHWITIILDNSIKTEEIINYIDISYNITSKRKG